MLTWVIYPPHFDKNKKYPALLYCEGGPQSTVSQFWSYRWNFQMMAANDYIVVAPNRRGLPGFGQEWCEAISGDYGGQCMKDYLSAIDALAKEPFIDENRLGAVGASFGGFSVFWLAGHHEGRFKALIAHDGMFNFESQYLETEEMWFVNWDLGGPFWEKDNPVVQWSYANSPHKFVDKWTAPILVIHGAKDYRIAYTQGMQAYNAAVLRGIPAEFLYFPDENHWVLQAQNGILFEIFSMEFRWQTERHPQPGPGTSAERKLGVRHRTDRQTEAWRPERCSRIYQGQQGKEPLLYASAAARNNGTFSSVHQGQKGMLGKFPYVLYDRNSHSHISQPTALSGKGKGLCICRIVLFLFSMDRTGSSSSMCSIGQISKR